MRRSEDRERGGRRNTKDGKEKEREKGGEVLDPVILSLKNSPFLSPPQEFSFPFSHSLFSIFPSSLPYANKGYFNRKYFNLLTTEMVGKLRSVVT